LFDVKLGASPAAVDDLIELLCSSVFEAGDNEPLINSVRPGDGAADDAPLLATPASGAVAATGKGVCLSLSAAFFDIRS